MTGDETARPTIQFIYKLTGVFGLIGFVLFFWIGGIRDALAFALGVLCSFGNLWMLHRITGAIVPGPEARKPLRAGSYFIRFAFLLAIGYGIVKLLNVSPIAVISGLLAGTAATLASVIIELVAQVFKGRTSH
ncbi:MAG TPA: ATP synthase subunit I [Bryobacteraceae bacterium]|jgi:hypothetical protein|nr:ATP synthase subunit I [Bryobacteraceae bacterium]